MAREYRRGSETAFSSHFSPPTRRRRDGTRAGSEPGRTSFQVRLPFATDWKGGAIDESMNLLGLIRSPLTMTPDEQVSDLADNVYRLACLELRGGNRGAIYPIELPGLNAWISCRPL